MDQVAQIREKIDIVSLLSEFMTLKKAGRNFKALCPFHSEKTPSFVISPERQIWHCFGGCNKGGDVYQFLMDYERIDFPEALRILAKRAGVELVSQNYSSGETSKKERLYQINSLAKEYYHYVLTKHPAGKTALKYLKNRGIDAKVIESFRVGFAPPDGRDLTKYLLNKKKFEQEDVLDAGLAFQRGRDLADFFRGRLMFPLIDHRDNVVGFAGRILENNDNVSKYVNTRETLIYHKGEQLFGLNVTKEAIRREGKIIIVEGEFDVMSCFQNGIGNVVALKGTALTEHQVNLIGRFSERIAFCFDGDKAGQEAIKRSLVVVEKKGLTPTVIEIPGGKDPDDALKDNASEFKKAVKEDVSVYDYLLDHALKSSDINSAQGKKTVSDLMLPFVGQISNEIIKEHYLKKIADSLDTSYESIVKEAERLAKKETKTIPAAQTPDLKRSKDEILEEYLLALIIQSENPKKAIQKAIEILSDFMSRERAYHKIMDHLLSHLEKSEKFDGEKFADRLPKELVATFDTSVLFPLPQFESEEKLLIEVEKASQKLKTVYIQEKMKRLAEEIKQGEAASVKDSGEPKKDLESLQKQYSELASHLQASK
ncbi:MAG TPA: DNA primase [Candidatus Saccharimonadales bacterium]|nr:DNA primase [Candidatus Saccharimonadales bacterium]